MEDHYTTTTTTNHNAQLLRDQRTTRPNPSDQLSNQRRRRTPPNADATPPESGSAPLTVLAVIGIGLRLAAVRYGVLYTRLRAPILLAVVTAFVLLAEAMVAVGVRAQLARELVGVARTDAHRVRAHRAAPRSARWREERFSDLYLDETARGQARGDRRLRRPLGLHVVLRGPRPARGLGDAQRLLRARRSRRSREHGGEIDRLVGDAIDRDVQHARRPARPRRARGARRAGRSCARPPRPAAEHPDWPRFRVGVNSGEAMVGVVGARRRQELHGDRRHRQRRRAAARARRRSAASRSAPATLRGLPGARVRNLGPVALKGKREPVDAYVLEQLD